MKAMKFAIVLYFLTILNFGLSDELDISDVVQVKGDSHLEVKYGDRNVEVGEELTPSDVKFIPSVTWPASKNTYYSLCLIDPDAPSRENPKARNWLHWMVGNIPGNDIASGKTLAEYVGAGPPQGTGLHRYIFLLFKQPSKINFEEPLIKKNTGKGRAGFNVGTFTSKYGLEPAIATNFFVAEWDSYVPELHKQLSGK